LDVVPQVDLPLSELRQYRSSATEPDGLDAFWRSTLDAARGAAQPPSFVPYREADYPLIEVSDVTFSGFAGQPVRAWLILPRNAGSTFPCLVRFIGYGGGRDIPLRHVGPATAGFAVFVMDTRGQGGSWSAGVTGDEAAQGGPEHPGVMTKGIQAPETYYYRRLFTDAARAVETAAAHDAIDEARIAVGGASQGGGLALAAGALVPDRVRLVQAEVPFLCDFPRAIEVAAQHPYVELAEFFAIHTGIVERALNTLSYFDCAVLARKITARCQLSVGLMDDVCPPSTVFAAYNAIEAEKEIAVYPYSGHVVPSAHEELRTSELRQFLTEDRR
jgi:cephalosporin-C deacetylase